MEIFFAFVVLIGVFSFGAASSEHEAADAQTTVPERAAKSSNEHPSPTPCRYSGKSVILRDLTVPFAAQPIRDCVDHDEVTHGGTE